MQVGNDMGQDPPHTWRKDDARRLWVQEQDAWKDFSTHVERHENGNHDALNAVSVAYPALDTKTGREKHAERIAKHLCYPATNREIIQCYLDRVWGEKPVNVGRLMQQKQDT